LNGNGVVRQSRIEVNRAAPEDSGQSSGDIRLSAPEKAQNAILLGKVLLQLRASVIVGDPLMKLQAVDVDELIDQLLPFQPRPNARPCGKDEPRSASCLRECTKHMPREDAVSERSAMQA
jgi:hypothetical protein